MTRESQIHFVLRVFFLRIVLPIKRLVMPATMIFKSMRCLVGIPREHSISGGRFGRSGSLRAFAMLIAR